MVRLTIVVYDSVHEKTQIYQYIDEIKIQDNVFKLIKHDDTGEHVYMFSKRFYLVGINIEKEV